jgi:hypothetical protein
MIDIEVFLDIDGCANNHSKFENGYSGVTSDCRRNINRLLREVPDSKIVVSSAWRYLVLNGSMTLKGFESLLLTHGLCVYNRIKGVTISDEEQAAEMGFPQANFNNMTEWHNWVNIYGAKIRKEQILKYVNKTKPETWVVIDDIILDIPNQIVTDYNIGFTEDDAEKAIGILRGMNGLSLCRGRMGAL